MPIATIASESYVIFGGAGFIGSHLVKALLEYGAKEIVVADINENSGPRYEGVVYKHCDVREKIPVDLISGPGIVVNLAAIHRTPGHEDHEYFDTNVKGANNVVDFCERTGSNVIWFTSSISVYGPSEDERQESSELKPESAYGQSKVQAEAIHRKWAEKDSGRKLVIARPAVVFGARENGNFTKLAKALKKGLFVYPGRKDTIKGCGYVEDLVGSLLFMHDQPDRFVLYNYCYPTPYTIKDICKAFVKVAGLKKPLGVFPLSLMVRIAKVFQFLDRIGLKNGIHPERMYKLIRSTHIVPGELIKRGYPYRTELDEGLKQWLTDEPNGKFI
ncbi:MAG: NAD(P)-dependent oxidoreductase [Candidatus Gracilibacteria bacterium]|nr:NAD(P)-dependent oxidoreductase [Candidatus Gracilibacteria bacterium]